MGECRNTLLCFVCLKPTSALDGSHEGNYSLEFLQFFTRFLEIPLKIPMKNQDLVSCDECFEICKSFRNLYSEWEKLRLQLEWRVKEIFEIIRATGEVHSSVKAFQNQFKTEDDDSNKVYFDIQTLRNEILRGCKKKLNSSFPRVVLETIPKEIVRDVSVPVAKVENFEILEWMMTFIAVFQLSVPHSVSNHEKDNDCVPPTTATFPSVETNSNPLDGVESPNVIDGEVYDCGGEVSEARNETEVPNTSNEAQADYHVQQNYDSDGEVNEEPQIETGIMTNQKDSNFSLVLISDAIAINATEAIAVLNPDTVSPVAEKSCHICQLTFSTPVLLTFHLRSIHHLRVPFECPKCGLVSLHIAIFRHHMRKAHKTVTGLPGPVQCDICMERFQNARSVRVHKGRVHKTHSLKSSLSQRPKSQMCWTKPKITVPLIRRRPTASVRGSFNPVGVKRPLYQTSSKNRETFAIHMKLVHHNTTGYNCAHCSTSLKSMEGFSAHMQIAHGKVFETTIALLSAENIRCSSNEEHSIETAGNEVQNGSPSSRPQNLNNEQEQLSGPSRMYEARETGSIPKPYSCEWKGCSRKFAWAYMLKLHYKKHSRPAPFRCKFCQLAFFGSAHLSNHLRVHGVEGNFKCNFKDCIKSYSTKSYLKIHQQTHLDQKHFKCGWKSCTQKFPTKKGLQLHQKLHTKLTPFRCLSCQLSFASPLRLKLHRGSHHRHPVEGDIPNDIPIASTVETVDGTAKETVSPNVSKRPGRGRKAKNTLLKNYKCEFGGGCHKSFASVGAWKSHQRIHNKVKSQCKWNGCSFEFEAVEELKRHYLQKHNGKQSPNKNHAQQQGIADPYSNDSGDKIHSLHSDSEETVAKQQPETPIWSTIPNITLPLIRRRPTASLRGSVNPVRLIPPQHLNSEQPGTSNSTMIVTLDNFAIQKQTSKNIALDSDTDEVVTQQEPETDNWDCVTCEATFDLASQLRAEHVPQGAQNSQSNEEERELEVMEGEMSQENGDDTESQCVEPGLIETLTPTIPGQFDSVMNIATSIQIISELPPAPQLQSGMEVEDNLLCANSHFETGNGGELKAHSETHKSRVGGDTTEENAFVGSTRVHKSHGHNNKNQKRPLRAKKLKRPSNSHMRSTMPDIALKIVQRRRSLKESVNPVGVTPPQHLNSEQPGTSNSTMIATLDNFGFKETSKDIALDSDTDKEVTQQEPETDKWECVTCQATFDQASQLSDHIREEHASQLAQNFQANEKESELEDMEVDMSHDNEAGEAESILLGIIETPPGQLDPGTNIAASIQTIPELSPTPQLQSGMEVVENLYFVCAHCHFETGDQEELQAHFETHEPRVVDDTTEENTFVPQSMEADHDEDVLKDDVPEKLVPTSGAAENLPVSTRSTKNFL